MTLNVMRARNASTPQIAGATKSTAQKKLLSVGWMKRCSCAQEEARSVEARPQTPRAGAAACLEALESPVVLPRLVHVVPPP